MIKTIIVDDEQNSIDALQITLAELRDDIEVIGVAKNARSAFELIKKNQPDVDLVFLDIQMPYGDGFSVLHELHTIDFKVIFISAYDQFAIKAIRYSALDYILKPVDPSELREALNNFDKTATVNPALEFKRTIAQKNYFDKLAIPTLNEVKFISLNSIVYFESKNNYTNIHLDNKEVCMVSKNIGFYEEFLEPAQFFRCHNSYLINISKISRYIKSKNGRVELNNSVILDVSSRRKKELLDILGI